MQSTVTKETLNNLMDLHEDVASFFTSDHVMAGKTYWTCLECLATAKIAEFDGKIKYEPNQRF